MQSKHETFISRCFQLASLGLGFTSTNPVVGCVIEYEGNIIAEGYHKGFGLPHAEIDAISKVKDLDILKKSTLYVNLEPCSHYGKTPPCADAIIDAGIPRVVISNIDSNVLVSGTGITRMREHGIEVITGILEDEGKELNKRFFTSMKLQRPYIVVKWAESFDSFLGDGTSNYPISHPHIKLLTHRWRMEEDAIWVGLNTIMIDDPELTVRYAYPKSQNIIIIDRKGKITPDKRIFQTNNKVIIFTDIEKHPCKKVAHEILTLPDEDLFDIKNVTNKIYQLGIGSLYVEGGYIIHSQIIESGVYDEVRRIVNTKLHLNSGTPAPKLLMSPNKKEFMFENVIDYFYFNNYI